MYVYHDVNYVNYICSLDLITGLTLYSRCLSRLHEEKEEIWDNRVWEMYMNRSESEKDLNFEEYKKRQLNQAKIENETKNMSNLDKDLEEERIINENKSVIELDQRRLKNGERIKHNQRRVTKIIKK